MISNNIEVDEETLKDLLKMGVVDFVEVRGEMFSWSFPMMRNYILHFLFCKNRPTKDKWKNLSDFILAAISRFSPLAIKVGVTTKTKHIRESHIQMEFYRVSYSLLPHKTVVKSELHVGEGRVDFYIDDSHLWLIEFVVENNDVPGHVYRVHEGGAYYKDIKEGRIKEWIVVHLLQQKHVEPLAGLPKGAWNVVVADEHFDKVTVTPWDNNADEQHELTTKSKPKKEEDGEWTGEQESQEDEESDKKPTKTIKFQVKGKFGAPREFPLLGDSLIDINTSSIIQISLRLMKANMEEKKKGMQPVPFHFRTFVEKAKEILQIPKATQIQLFMEIGEDEIEINETNLDRLENKQTVIVRLTQTKQAKEDEKFSIEEQQRKIQDFANSGEMTKREENLSEEGQNSEGDEEE